MIFLVRIEIFYLLVFLPILLLFSLFQNNLECNFFDKFIRLEYINKEKDESIIDFEEKMGSQKDNLDILRSVIDSIKDEDIDELNDISRMLIREIILISKDSLKLQITLDI